MERLNQGIAGFLERIQKTKEELSRRKGERRQRFEEVVVKSKEVFLRRNAFFEEKAEEYGLLRALETLNQKKLSNKGLITRYFPYEIFEENFRFYCQINRLEGNEIRPIKKEEDLLEILMIPVEEVILSWELLWDGNHIVEIGIDGNFNKVEISAGTAVFSRIFKDFMEGNLCFGQGYFRSFELPDSFLEENLRTSLLEACENSGFYYANFGFSPNRNFRF